MVLRLEPDMIDSKRLRHEQRDGLDYKLHSKYIRS